MCMHMYNTVRQEGKKHGTQSVCVLCNMDDVLFGLHSSYIYIIIYIYIYIYI